MKLDLDELERKASEASNAALSDHHWRVYRCRSADEGLACGIKDEPFVSEDEDAYQNGIIIDTNRDECQHAIAVEDAEHIAANSPPVTLALIARIRELEGALEDAIDYEPLPRRDILRACLEKGVVLP